MTSTIRWTQSQQDAIMATGRPLLVSASAGAGKTAVLAQRCLQRINDPEHLVDVDRILVLTYTDAAAEEMHDRIARTLRSAYQRTRSEHLRRQALFLDAAWISTFHAFCKRILTEHFYLLDLDPAFGIVDPDQQRLLQSEALLGSLQQAWTDSQMMEKMRTLFYRRHVQPSVSASFISRILDIRIFLESIPDSADFFTRIERQIADPAALPQELLDQQHNTILSILQTCREKIDFIRLLDQHFTGGRWLTAEKLSPYYEKIDALEQSAKRADWPGLANQVNTLNFQSLRRPNNLDETAAKQIKEPLAGAVKQLKELADLALVSPHYAQFQTAAAADQIRTLLELVRRFGCSYDQAKRQINSLDFSDLEQKMLILLREHPSTVEKLRRRFEYIFVDEFQDINAVQKQILDAIARPDNLFAVGDVKQSIYAFRRSRPELFLAALNAANEEPDNPNQPQRIDLGENFRSRRQILEFANAIFGRIMTEQTASMNYDDRAALRCVRPDLKDSESPMPVELILLDDDPDDSPEEESARQDEDNGETGSPAELVSSLQRQAAFIARRIRQMVGADNGQAEFQIFDKHAGKPRDVQYRDIVILMRSVAHRANEYTEILRQAGIPVSSQTGSGYFAATEIADLLALLKVLDNPIRDIELAAVLRSRMFGFTDSELADIRLGAQESGDKNCTFYDALRRCSQSGPAFLRQKTERALAQLQAWREDIRIGSLADTLGKILEQTGFLAFVSALPNGRQRRANLLKLHDRAIQFEHFSSGPQSTSLARFVEFLEDLADQQQDWAPAQPDSAAENAVRLLSVHRSKGLEFPVVILAELNTRFNIRDLSDPCLIDEDALGLKIIDPQKDVAIPTLAHQVLAERKRKTLLEEEMRILYVALTRAREKLIVSAARKESPCRRILLDCAVLAGRPVPAWQLLQVQCPIDWVLWGLGDRPALQAQYLGFVFAGPYPDFFTVRRVGGEELNECTRFIEATRQKLLQTTLPEIPPDVERQADVLHIEAAERLRWSYPFVEAVALPAKLSVSQLTHRTDEFSPAFDEGPWRRLPECLLKSAQRIDHVPAAQIGTAVHLVLARLDLSARPDRCAVERTIQTLCREEVLSPDLAGRIDIPAILGFFDTPLGALTLRHGTAALREWPFTLALSAKEAAIGQSDEKIILQGIVDLIVPAPEGLVIIDFKTDRIQPEQLDERLARYSPQIRYYAAAAQKILARPVVAAYFYFLSLSKSVQANL